MSDCRSSACDSGGLPRKYTCPVNGKAYAEVSPTTILHHISKPWKWKQKDQGYYFCTDPDCDVVYFGQDNSVIKRSALRSPVGIKSKSSNALVCYCFGVTFSEAVESPDAKAFVLKETKANTCACETRNPSGRCCLKDFPKA